MTIKCGLKDFKAIYQLFNLHFLPPCLHLLVQFLTLVLGEEWPELDMKKKLLIFDPIFTCLNSL